MKNADTLSSLAMLKVNIDSGGDYLEYLRPYVLHALLEDPPEVVTDSSVSDRVRQIFGLEIPRRAISIVLQRLAKSKYLRKADGVFTVVKDLPIPDIRAAQADAARHIAAINKALIAFAEKSAARVISDETATDCLIAFLSQFSIPCLKYYLRGTTLPIVNGHVEWRVVLVSQFVNELALKPDLFESFMMLAQGHMLANALLCPDLQSVSDSYKDVTFYFDTPLLIQLLGLEGEREQQAINEVVVLVQRLGGRVAYFTHTLDELVGAIKGSADFIDSLKGKGSIVLEARKSGRTKSDLLLIAQNASDILLDLSVKAVSTPPYHEETFKFEISEDIFTSILDDEVNYHNPRAKEYDIRSVRSIYLLRRGRSPFSIEKSIAVLVTNNASFSKAAYDYGKNFEQSREVSAVITDFSLANTAWLKAPQGAPSLPKKEILAFAYAALRPPSEFWNRVRNEAEKLESQGKISSRDHQLLRSSYHVQCELMKLTLGEDGALTEESITTTISRVSAEIRKAESEKLQQSEEARAETERMLAQQVAQTEQIKTAIYWRCSKRAGREALIVSSLIWLSQLAIATFGIIKIPDNSVVGSLVVGIAALSGLVRLAGAQWDIKPLKVYAAFGKWRLEILLKREYSALAIPN